MAEIIIIKSGEYNYLICVDTNEFNCNKELIYVTKS